MAAEIEQRLDEGSELIQSSGGVFEVEYQGRLLFSKKALGRFPVDGEVLRIVQALNSGTPLAQAQADAAANAPRPISFADWFQKLFKFQIR